MIYVTRAVREDDLAFMRKLHEASMRPHVERQFGNWDKEFQAKMFDEAVPKPDHEIIEVDGKAVGLLHVLQDQSMVILDQLWLLPSHQNLGIGSDLIRKLVSKSEAQAIPIRLSVLIQNPAVSLYKRLGFEVISQSETHFTMLRTPSGEPTE